MSATTKAARTKVSRRLGWLRQLAAFVGTRVDLPPVNLPDFQVQDHRRLAIEDIERFAEATRRFWGMGDHPISNVLWLLENNGVIVGRLQFEAAGMDGVSQWAHFDGRPYMLIASDKDCAVRSRFDAAHELAHLLLHRAVDRKQLNTAADFKLIEQQAHRFAGAFLLPARTFSQEALFPTLDRFRSLKAKQRVSIALMVKRASDLNFLSEEQERRMWMAYARRGWRGHEPLDGELEPEQPRLFRKAFELLFEEGRLTLDELAQELPLARNDIEDLATLSRGYLSEERGATAPVIMLKPKPQTSSPTTLSSAEGDLLPFPRRT
jgi:Zn-dependent peptidase ImmA (M78 family)